MLSLINLKVIIVSTLISVCKTLHYIFCIKIQQYSICVFHYENSDFVKYLELVQYT